MKVLTWNCQGAGNEKFLTNFRELVKLNNPDIIYLMETKVSEDRARTISTSLGFSGVCRAPTVGREGGIWLLWHKEDNHVDIVCVDHQAIHAIIGTRLQNSWLCSGIYAKPNPAQREGLWSKLEEVGMTINLPWLVTGDFNEVLDCNEKRGGNAPALGRCLRFKEMIDNCGLIDLGFRGPRFTWSNKRKGLARVRERIDRSMANAEWQNLFPNGTVLHLPRTHSDHHPVLTLCDGFVSPISNKPFRFELAWTTDPQCKEIVQHIWDNCRSILEAISKIPNTLRDWNRNNFGNIFEKKRRILARINGIQRSLGFGENDFLSALEEDLISEYNEVLAQEELLWFQKSRVKWLEFGDRNTKFFHITTLCRRRKNNISALKIEGFWQTDDSILRSHVFEFFSSLFRHEECRGNTGLPMSPLQKRVPVENVSKLVSPVSMMEVKRIVQNLSPYKAPGPDGLQAFFYQTFWESVGESVYNLVEKAFSEGCFEGSLGESFICLIPKETHPESITKFRPIALCNVLYKVITKTIAERLKPLMPELVSPLQSSFIPGRGTHDNILMIQELLHTLRKRKKNKVGSMVIKLDLEKAYDRINWSFLEQTLQFFGIPDKLLSLILFCVKCVKPRILWNGGPLEAIEPNCGLRQGDPLSPYLFVLCIERLSYMIGEAVTKRKWQPLKPCRGGPNISHLFFADDLLLMAKATPKNARCIRKVLDSFCDSSGLKVSFHKSKVFFAKQGERSLQREISSILDIGRTTNLGRYLGAPLLHGRASPGVFREVVDRVANRLSTWKAKLLSLAGRATLIQSVTTAIPSHVMQSTWLPSSTCDYLDKLNRSFLWSSDATQKKIHLVGWHKVTKKKANGGLGIRQARNTNISLLAKVGWKIFNKENTLWGELFRKKYLKDTDPFNYRIKGGESHTWKGVVKSMKAVESCVIWRLGDGKSISLWKDKWLSKGPLISRVDECIHEEDIDFMVSDIIDATGNWNGEKLKTKLSTEIWNEITSNPIPFNRDQLDKRIWGGTTNGIFTCKSAYSALEESNQLPCDTDNTSWNWVWKFKSSARIRFFIWTCLHNSIATNVLRYERKLTTSNICIRCNCHAESIIHALRDCPTAKEVWEYAIIPTQFLKFSLISPEVWIKDNITKESFDNILSSNMPWSIMFVALLWSIWKARNKFIFQNIKEPPRITLSSAKRLADELSKMGRSTGTKKKMSSGTVKWSKPNTGWHKLNTDGSVFTTKNSAAAGGLIRNEEGEWVVGFSHKLGNVSITYAELIAARDGLKLAWDRRIQRIVLEIDSKVVVSLLQHADVVTHPLGCIIKDCRDLLRMPWESLITHTKRDGNGCGDILAKKGHYIQESFVVWDEPIVDVLPLLLEEML